MSSPSPALGALKQSAMRMSDLLIIIGISKGNIERGSTVLRNQNSDRKGMKFSEIERTNSKSNNRDTAISFNDVST